MQKEKFEEYIIVQEGPENCRYCSEHCDFLLQTEDDIQCTLFRHTKWEPYYCESEDFLFPSIKCPGDGRYNQIELERLLGRRVKIVQLVDSLEDNEPLSSDEDVTMSALEDADSGGLNSSSDFNPDRL